MEARMDGSFQTLGWARERGGKEEGSIYFLNREVYFLLGWVDLKSGKEHLVVGMVENSVEQWSSNFPAAKKPPGCLLMYRSKSQDPREIREQIWPRKLHVASISGDLHAGGPGQQLEKTQAGGGCRWMANRF